ncbi:MAG: BTAD domain-containing putative transcriptional regulator, partial [Micromonosporaceae bacterium]
MEFSLLGPVAVRHDGRTLPGDSGRERYVLAVLLLNADRLTTVDTLITGLWQQPPASARQQLHNLINKLRRRLAPADEHLIETRPQGYRLRLDGHQLDLREFRRLAEHGRQAATVGDHGAAAALLAEGLALWRGPVLGDVTGHLAGEIRDTLYEERLAAAEVRLDALLATGDHNRVLRELAPLLAEHPYAEHLHVRQLRALVGAGRRTDALAAYRRAHQRFVDDLGVEPGPSLRELGQRIHAGDPLDVPPVPARPVPRQLPPAASLTGRDTLLNGVSRALSDAGVAVLTGPGGIGKSAVALAAGHQLTGSFPGGQLYADLRGSHQPVDPYAVTGRFLRALGVEGTGVPDNPDERTAMYREQLRQRRLLVVLDDASGEAQVRPLLPTAPGGGPDSASPSAPTASSGSAAAPSGSAAAGSAVVVTSRRQLTALPGVTGFTVSALDPGDGTSLLARTVGADRIGADPEAADEIVRICGGLPLAVCIAAARLAVRPDWDLALFRTRLAAERGRLDELSVGDLDVRASLALSYRMLPDGVRRLFRRLGQLGTSDWPGWIVTPLLDDAVGPGTAVAMAGTAGPGTTATAGTTAAAGAAERGAALLSELVDVHLVESLGTDAAGQDRYRLHDLVATYAAELADAGDPVDDREAAGIRLLDNWLAMATAADEHVAHGMISAVGLTAAPVPPGVTPPGPDTASQWFELERENLVAAVDQACRYDLPELAGKLALRMCGFLGFRAYDDDRARTVSAATDCVRRHAADDLLSRLLSALFAAYWDLSAYHRLSEIAAEQLAVAKRLGDRTREVRALTQAGHAARIFGRLTEAADWLDQAMARYDTGTPSQLVSTVLSYRASIHAEHGRPALALPLSERAVDIERRHDRPRTRAWRLMSYGEILTDLDRPDAAADALYEALEATAPLGDQLTNASIEQRLAVVEIRRGRHSTARELSEGSLSVAEDLG